MTRGGKRVRVCVVGTGNVGCALAAVWARDGYDVTLLKTSTRAHNDNFDVVERQKGLVLQYLDAEQEFVPLRRVTRNFDAALGEQLDLVFVATQTHAHRELASRVAASLKSAKALIVAPGYLGSVYFRRALTEDCVPIVAEGESPPYDARIEAPGFVRVCFKNARNALSFLPSESREEGLKLASSFVDTYQYSRSTVLESALHNPNLVLHTAGTILSASRIEYSRGEFWLYREAFTPSVWRVIDSLDAEKNAVLEAFGLEPMPYLRACQFRNERELGGDPFETFQSYATSGGPKCPGALDTRFLTEDVPNGLGLLASLGRAVGVPTPIAESLIVLSGALLGRNFQRDVRTLESLGFSSVDELKEFIGITNEEFEDGTRDEQVYVSGASE